MTVDDTRYACPVCDHEPLARLDIPKYKIYQCTSCSELVQRLQDGNFSPISMLLQRNELGDDRVRAATSTPHVTTVKSFLDVHDNAMRILELNLAEARGGLRPLLAQIENRIDYALQTFAGLDFVSDEAGKALAALRVARELVSTQPSRNRGVQLERIQSPKGTADDEPI